MFRDAPMMSPEGGTIVVYDCSAMEAWKDLADCDKRKLCRHDADTDSVSLQIEQDWSSFIMLVIIKMTANAPHGNARKNAQPYIRTLPATRHDIRRSLLVTHYVAETYNSLQGHNCAAGKEAIALARNQQQVQNELRAMLRETSLNKKGEVRAKIEHELDVLFAQKVAAEVAQLFDESARESVMERLLAMVADESSS
ncbi:hypothetical protein Tcan_11510 [Toxocara canis]|uniref:Uncharacterized protein n=1 Tax=Toxocara canis TaxID=6265 RepID=A0A0B2V4B1_TOXCA|nr:hypothetical protein Tcan_11510 [Toxocara canis]